MMRIPGGLIASIALMCVASASAAPVFLGDNSTSKSSVRFASEFTPVGDYVYFTAYGALGEELYRTDKANSNVQLVKDILPGISGSRPEQLTVFKDELYFLANDGVHNTELWKTDGTPQGTALVVDFATGSFYPYQNNGFAVTDEKFFGIVRAGNTPRLVVMDDSRTTFSFVGDLVIQGSQLISVRDHVYVVGRVGNEPAALWKSDGTEAGTKVAVAATDYGTTATVTSLSDFNGSIYFQGTDGTRTGIWTTPDFSVPAIFLYNTTADFEAGFAALDGDTYFSALSGSNSSAYGLWKTNNTAAGTTLVKDLQTSRSWRLKDLGVAGSHLVFRIGMLDPGLQVDSTLWSSDGTEAGTAQLVVPAASSFRQLVYLNGTAYMDMFDESYGYELWQTDGTADGTTITVDVYPGQLSSIPDQLTPIGDTLFFHYWYGIAQNAVAAYHSATGELKLQCETGPQAGLEVTETAVIGDKVFYCAGDGEYGREPWVSDGTRGGTFRLADISPGATSSYPTQFTAVGNVVYFLAEEQPTVYDLWKTDGTVPGTSLVARLNARRSSEMVAVGTELYINAQPTESVNAEGAARYKARLWRSNGTAAGTYVSDAETLNQFIASTGDVAIYSDRAGRLTATNPATSETVILSLASVRALPYTGYWPAYVQMDGSVYFPVTLAYTTDYQLWKSDGTAAGTSVILDPPGKVDDMVVGPEISGRILIRAGDQSQTLWLTDGTPAGAIQLGTYNFPFNGVGPVQAAAVGDQLVFAGAAPGGPEPWITDGTAAGTRLLKNVNATTSTLGSQPALFTSVGDYVYFRADDGVSGHELWRTDGTEANTKMAIDLNPGAEGSVPIYLMDTGGDLLFSAYDPVNGWEMRRITSSGQVPELLEIAPGPGSSGPSNLVNLGSKVVFQAYAPESGADLWALDVNMQAGVEDWTLY